MYELELRYTVICLQIKLAPCVSRAERYVFNMLSFFENVRKTKQDPEGVNCDIDRKRGLKAALLALFGLMSRSG